MATVKLSFGLCEEELGNFAEAKKIYRDIVADPSLEGAAAVASAKLRLKTMDDYKKKIVFAKTPERESTSLEAQGLLGPVSGVPEEAPAPQVPVLWQPQTQNEVVPESPESNSLE